MGTYRGSGRPNGRHRGTGGRRRLLPPWGAAPAPSGVTPQVTGDPDPGCSLSDVPMSYNDQDRIARITTERGAILPMMAIMLVVLLGAAAMAVDLGWLYWQSIEIQHGADAAALAGVIYEPDQRTEAHAEALAAAVTNGYDDTSAGTAISVVDFLDDPSVVEHNGQLRVTVTHTVDTFFLPIFGIGDVDIAPYCVGRVCATVGVG